MPQELKSVLLEEPKIENLSPNYTTDQQLYLRNLQKRLEFAKFQREQSRDEFDGMNYEQYWLENEKGANTYIKPKKDKSEINFQSGTLRQKLFSLVSSLQSLNLGADILAFDRNETIISSLGQAMEDIVEKTEELEGDEEKRMLRQYEMIKQGDVFIEDVWKDEGVTDKETTKEFNGKFNDVFWKTNYKETEGKAERNIISGLKIYLGDLTKYFITDQPFIFTRASFSYKELERIYGEWEMWKYVSKQQRNFVGENSEDALVTANWNLQYNPDGKCEIIKYQDVPNNEYQILINGIPMMPIGSPLPWGRYYNITQQHFEPIRENFAYGKSFIFRNRNNVYLIDEMIKMALLKTWKSFMPPYINTSGQVIRSTAFMPGKINMGIKANTLIPLEQNAVQGVTTSEFNMVQEMIRFVDANTTSQTFGGMQERGATTATQIVEIQRQARIMLGVVILAASLLEKKITYLRVNNLLKNRIEPSEMVLDEVKNILKNRYRIVSRKRQISEEGIGMRYVVPTEENVNVGALRAEEEQKKQKLGMPIRIIAINPNELKQAKYFWFISVNPKEKKSSEMSKLMFSEMISQATQLGLQLNPQLVQDKFAEVWDLDPSKLFAPQATQMQASQGQLNQGEQQEVMPQNKPTGVQKPTVNQLMESIGNKQLA